ncbi:MAG: alpha-L-fucosidase [Verrucomicrobia bacterium]|nr:alpha-L-fucosidase [Verrucomicrobiota bacterium]MBU1855396.1 alpha-L-fucosidase [Verrucomicrobiota bacterium]
MTTKVRNASKNWFAQARYGMFIHYGLYSLLERGEWVLNREEIPLAEYKQLANRFTAIKFDADFICDLAVRGGMRYIVLTTMHHDGFRLYDTKLTDFCTTRTAAGRDLVGELVKAARKRKLRIGLYHSLNNWHDKPDAVDALESKAAYATFIKNTFARIRELVTKYNPIDVLWYDGWWPFDAKGWCAAEMNEMVRKIQPCILLNGRNGLPGDFATPEGHLAGPQPWRPWEACITTNSSWGYCRSDNAWKTPGQLVDMFITVAQGNGNLLLNIGPCGDGSAPKQAQKLIMTAGDWLRCYSECIFDTDRFIMHPQEREGYNGDWAMQGSFTIKGNTLYMLVRRWPGESLTFGGLQCRIKKATLLGRTKHRLVKFVQQGTRVMVTGLPKTSPDPVCPVLRFDCDRPPSVYQTGGLRIPNVKHPHYDPVQSDIKY